MKTNSQPASRGEKQCAKGERAGSVACMVEGKTCYLTETLCKTVQHIFKNKARLADTQECQGLEFPSWTKMTDYENLLAYCQGSSLDSLNYETTLALFRLSHFLDNQQLGEDCLEALLRSYLVPESIAATTADAFNLAKDWRQPPTQAETETETETEAPNPIWTELVNRLYHSCTQTISTLLLDESIDPNPGIKTIVQIKRQLDSQPIDFLIHDILECTYEHVLNPLNDATLTSLVEKTMTLENELEKEREEEQTKDVVGLFAKQLKTALAARVQLIKEHRHQPLLWDLVLGGKGEKRSSAFGVNTQSAWQLVMRTNERSGKYQFVLVPNKTAVVPSQPSKFQAQKHNSTFDRDNHIPVSTSSPWAQRHSMGAPKGKVPGASSFLYGPNRYLFQRSRGIQGLPQSQHQHLRQHSEALAPTSVAKSRAKPQTALTATADTTTNAQPQLQPRVRGQTTGKPKGKQRRDAKNEDEETVKLSSEAMHIMAVKARGRGHVNCIISYIQCGANDTAAKVSVHYMGLRNGEIVLNERLIRDLKSSNRKLHVQAHVLPSFTASGLLTYTLTHFSCIAESIWLACL